MSEYFNWINIDRKEYLEPADFDWAINYHHSLQTGNPLLPALRELLATDWKGCRIIHFGDERVLPHEMAVELFKPVNEFSTRDDFPDGIYEIYGEYKNVSCLFESAEKEVREHIQNFVHSLDSEIEECNDYQIDPIDPYKGLFKRKGQNFEYTINHTKREYYSLDSTKMFMLDGTEYGNHQEDPLGYLVGYGRVCPDGPWLGDIIGVSDEIPEGYKFLDKIYFNWWGK